MDIHEPRLFLGRQCRIKDSGSVKPYTIAALDATDAGRVFLSADGYLMSKSLRVDRLDVIEEKPHVVRERFGVGLDAPRVDHDEATELFAHMAMLSHMYFQAVPDEPATRDEVIRIVSKREHPEGIVMIGVLAMFDALQAEYDKSKAND